MSIVKNTILYEIMLPGEIYRVFPHLCGAIAMLVLGIVSMTSWLDPSFICVPCALMLLVYAVVVLVARNIVY